MQERPGHCDSQVRNQTGGGIGRIQDLKGSSGFENTKQSDNKGAISLCVNRYDVFSFNPSGHQIISKLITALIQFTITPTIIQIDDREKIRRALSLLSE